LRRAELLGVGVTVAASLSHRIVPPRARLVANVVGAAAAIALARRAGVDWSDLGLEPRRVVPGLRWGTGAAVAVGAAAATAASRASVRRHFADERVAAHSRATAAYEMGVRIPVETALAEEVLFRGALLGLARSRRRPVVAIGEQAILFGLWHVLPTLADLDRSAVGSVTGSGPAGRAGAVAGVVVATAAAGVAFGALRLGSRSVVAPVLAHAAVNLTSFALARAAVRETDGARIASRR
jgi:membrane protease YdiL (CAAX protease family)